MGKKVEELDWDSDDNETVPYQFDAPVKLHGAVMQKSKDTGVKLAPYMRMCFENFLTTPIGSIVEEIEAHRNKKKKGSK
jgi:hypothetical protein